jgi:hypothetical protein
MERTLWKMDEVPGEVRLAFGRVGEGPNPVLALHGITAQHRSFNAVARHLESSVGIVGLLFRAGPAAVEEYERGDALGVHERGLQGHERAHGVAADHAALHAQVVERAHHVPRVRFEPVAAFGRLPGVAPTP